MRTAQINVTAATLWTEPASPRELDQPALEQPVRIEAWLDGMSAEERKELLDGNKVQSQVLYGDTVTIEEVKDDWAQVVVLSQSSKKHPAGYPGWIPVSQLTEIDADDMDPAEEKAIVTSDFTQLLDENGKTLVSLAFTTILPVTGLEDGLVEVHTPHGQAFLKRDAVTLFNDELEKGTPETILKDGERFLDLLYLWGGMTPFGYDCSGFSYSMMRANGYLIPRDASDQAAAGKEIEKEDVKPGDLIFFAYEEGKGRLHHVAIYHGDGKMIHSPTPGKKIMIQEIAGTFYEKEWCQTRRYWQE
ncbi:C40 family peptidase [Jeotgalibacillus haloalkalitolerans]|uniref:C40 family peptidase n=1 Tax=Jeotgalibacillus haloalkalitolerans TaxID=3104292 RepID=A0ABU5KIB5_9BACL|nr:C40 family peptidase [Jeotgalibacillus sp. HH7-29]MDZ5710977.1 C40 family peptidase [Jeotgalibacillus sp. HH7-29]